MRPCCAPSDLFFKTSTTITDANCGECRPDGSACGEVFARSKDCDRPGHEVIDQFWSAGELIDDDLLRLWPELACWYPVSGSNLDLHERRAGYGSADSTD